MPRIISPIPCIMLPIISPIPLGAGLAEDEGIPVIPPGAGLAPVIGLADGGGIAIGLPGFELADDLASGALGFWPVF